MNLQKAYPQASTASNVDGDSCSPCPPTILIVEDNPDNAFLARYICEDAGYVPSAASSGSAALNLLEQQAFNLLLLDIVLPDMDGFMVLEAIRQRHPKSSMPIVAVTAMAYQWQQTHILEAGFDDYLCKPYTVEAMESILLKYHPLKSSCGVTL